MEKVVIYKITNISNGKLYIGQSNNPAKRWKEHTYAAENAKGARDSKLYKAMRKYGLSCFTFEEMCTCISRDAADQIEKALIALWNTQNSGYNTTIGGGAIDSDTAKAIGNRPEQKKLRSERMKARYADPTERAKQAAIMKAITNRPEVKAAISVSMRKRQSKPVRLSKDGNVKCFARGIDADAWLGKAKSTVTNAIGKGYNVCGWKAEFITEA